MTIEIKATAKIHHATKAKAEKLAALLTSEYLTLSLHPLYNEDDSKVTGWAVVHTTTTGEADDSESHEIIVKSDKVPDLVDIFDACDEKGIDPEEGADEHEASGSIVPEEYRARYREDSSNGQTCGDWLAEWLVNQTHGIEGFNVEDFHAILSANALDMTRPWAGLYQSGQKGWIGRYRMNGRQVLEKQVAWTGFVIDAQGTRFDVPEPDLTILRRRHAKWIEKEQRRIAKEEAKTKAA